MTETTRRILEALDNADKGRLRIEGLAAPPYREDALLGASKEFRGLCRSTGRSTTGGFSVDVEVLPEGRARSREVALGFLNHLLDLSIRNHFRCH